MGAEHGCHLRGPKVPPLKMKKPPMLQVKHICSLITIFVIHFLANIIRPLDKSVLLNNYFHISQPNGMLF